MRRSRLAGIALAAALWSATAHAQTAALPEGWVVLSVDEYRALRERAYPAPPAAPLPPTDAALTRIDYDLRIDGDAVSGRALLTVDVLRDGWTRVPMPAGLLVREATIDGRRLAIVDGVPRHVLLSRAGRSVLTLDVIIPLSAASGVESIVLPAAPSPISRARLTLPRNGIDLSLTGGLVADHDEAANESRWTLFGQPNVPLAVTWKRRIDDRRADQPLRLRARITELAAFGEDSCQISAAVRVEVLQGLAREVTLQLPPGFVVNQVNGSTVADWESVNGSLRVALLEPTAAEASFIVQGDARTARDGAMAVPLIRMPAAERETGGVAVDIAGAGEVGAPQARGLERTDPAELGDIVANRESPSMIAFRHRPIRGSDARSLAVEVVRYTPQAVMVANIEEARYRALASEDGRLLVEGRYAIRNNQRSFLKAVLPDGSTLWSAEVAGRPVRPGLAEGGAVLLPLQKGRTGEQAPTFVVTLVYLQRIDVWSDKAHARLALPALDLPVSRTGLSLHYSPRFRIQTLAGVFREDQDSGPSAEALRSPSLSMTVTAEADKERAASGLQALVDRFRNESGARSVAGTLPVEIDFPQFGPVLFLASELTAETRAPQVELLVRRIS